MAREASVACGAREWGSICVWSAECPASVLVIWVVGSGALPSGVNNRQTDGVLKTLKVETGDTTTGPWASKRDIEVVAVSFWRMLAFFFDTVSVYRVFADECPAFHFVEGTPGGGGGSGGHCWKFGGELVSVSSLETGSS